LSVCLTDTQRDETKPSANHVPVVNHSLMSNGHNENHILMSDGHNENWELGSRVLYWSGSGKTPWDELCESNGMAIDDNLLSCGIAGSGTDHSGNPVGLEVWYIVVPWDWELQCTLSLAAAAEHLLLSRLVFLGTWQ